MNNINVCRICLIMNVKMYNLRMSPLDTYFGPIIDNNPLSMIELPNHACYECTALIIKYYAFREKCMRGETILNKIIQDHGELNPEVLQSVDRQEHRLVTQLCKTKIQKNSYISDVNNPETVKVEEIEGGYVETIECLPKIEDMDLKYEVLIDNSPFPPELSPLLMSSSDDEPLANHKNNKEKKKKQKTKKRKKDTKDTVDNKESKDVISCSEEVPEPLEKRKRGRPKKEKPSGSETEPKVRKRRTHNTGGVDNDELDLEEFCTVVELSLEEQIEEVKQRQSSSNYVHATFKCDLCYKGFIEPGAWRHHLNKHNPDAGSEECPVCKVRFKTKRILQKHAMIHEKKFLCKSCSYVSKTTTQAKQHQRWHKGVTYKCQYCDEVSTKWTSYLSHVRIKHPSEHVCNVCGYSFVSKLGLSMHKTMMHKDEQEKKPLQSTEGETPYCAECDVQFASSEAWKRHMLTSTKHSDGNKFSTKGCRECGETFTDAESYRLHHRRQHARPRPKNYGKKPHNTWPTACTLCNAWIVNAREYWTHYRREHPDHPYPTHKAYICEICGKAFRGNAFLVYHKRTHFEERAYKCEKCPKAFFNRTNLQMHEKTHSDSRPYPCSACFKAFKCKAALDRHFRCHTGEKPYVCEVCGKSFGQSNSRKVHVQTVHGKQPAPYVSRSRQDKKRQRSDANEPSTMNCYN